MIWSPSTIPPDESTAKTRSASPSRASPSIGARGKHRFTHGFRMLRTTSIVDVAAVGRGVDRDDVGPERVEHQRADRMGSAVRGSRSRRCMPSRRRPSIVDDQPIDVRVDAERAVARHRFLTTTPARAGSTIGLDRGRLHAVRAACARPAAKSLMPLSAIGVVRRRDHRRRRIEPRERTRDRGGREARRAASPPRPLRRTQPRVRPRCEVRTRACRGR